MSSRYRSQLSCLILTLFLLFSLPVSSLAEDLRGFDLKAAGLAEDCTEEIVDQFNLLLSSGKLTMYQLFDTFYIPIPNTSPQKYHTQYDRMVDGILRPILDRYLGKNKNFIFVVAVDKNGYLPTHNSKYSQPLTGDGDVDTKRNRTKRIFNDRTGLAAARNEDKILLQRYSRDTGEVMTDLSVPIFIKGQHWGAIRIGYKKQ